ncbi:MAG TPA: GTPase [Gemmataceae bacterium]|nr:GTPase [Gemmataceae bacterium]
MSRWRIAVVAALLTLPILFLVGMGGYYLWQSAWGFYLWWPMAACFVLGYFLAWYWQRKRQLLHSAEAAPPMHWTDQDRQAWQLVEVRAKAAGDVTLEQLGEIQFYVETAQSMALELARFYHPGTADPIGLLTVPELLAVIELAAHDLAEMVDQSLPAGHLLTVNDWRWARRAAEQASKWYERGRNVYWLVSAFFSPVETAAKYLTARLGMGRPWDLLQQDLIAWFHTAFVHRLGTYLIELNSGRLRVGARRYRELMDAELKRRRDAETQRRPEGEPAPAVAPSAGADGEVGARHVTLTIFGQVKAGKSSLINALLGEQRAQTDVLPATGEVTRYELQPQGIATRLVLLDTVGYGHTGPKEDQLRVTEECAQQSDLLLLVLHARNPARQADVETLQSLESWFADRPHLKKPPILAVLTHIDLLSPAMEWAPPYDWQQPRRPKEEQIRQALAVAQEQLGERVAGVVPVCAAPGKVYGVADWLLPAVVERMDEAHAVSLLRCLRAEIDTGKIRKVFAQLLSAGRKLATALRHTTPR